MAETASFTDEAIDALAASQLNEADRGLSQILAMRAMAWATLANNENSAVKEMTAHCAETDHALTLRLIDTDVFAVHCIPNCSFRTEWRTR